jgi:quercetin dioxygenase-like cupin family protein
MSRDRQLLSIDVHLFGEDSGGRLSAVEYVAGPHFGGPPLHRHAFDEAWYVLEGELTFRIGDELRTAGAGSFVYAPGGTPHTLANRSGRQARVLLLCLPAGLERYFERLGAQVAGLEPPASRGPDPETEVLGPPLGA